MVRIILGVVILLTGCGPAMVTVGTRETLDGERWSEWMYAAEHVSLTSSERDFVMRSVAADCHAARFTKNRIVKPKAVQVRFSDGSEEHFNCDDIRSKHPR